jgi:hypothetical protein
MRLTIEALFMRVVVRRTGVGLAPFTWEVHGDAAAPIHVSDDRYTSMDAAYEAGQARLPEFLPKRSVPSDNHGNHRWKWRPPGLQKVA